VILPPFKVALQLPAVRTAALLIVVAPVIVRWVGASGQEPIRLRVVGMLLAAAFAMVWDDRCAVLTAPTPVGLPAVRRGRAVMVLSLLLVAWGCSCLAASGHGVPYAVISLQTGATAVLLVAVMGWLSRDRDGEQLLALAVPVVLVTVAVMTRLPDRFSLLTHQPGDIGWPAERVRWLGLLALSVLLVLHLDRDPATPSLRQHSYARRRQPAP
jgi:hypothetical protein